jgi:DNA-binding transcriptional LysR family regulator
MSHAKADDMFLFVQVVDAGSFSKVAQQLELTNSVVSKRIGRLEEALNMQLLYRSTRKLSLTDGGKTLYHKAKIAKEALQEAHDAVWGYSDSISGKIKITVPSVSARLTLTAAVTEFCRQYKEVTVEMMIDDRFVNLIEEGFDLAIRTGYLEDSSLLARRLVDSHWVIVATPQYLKQQGVPESSDELKFHNCLTYKYDGAHPNQWQFFSPAGEYSETVQGNFIANDLNALYQAVLGGLGVAYLPRALVYDDLQSGKLRALLADFTAKKVGIYAVYPKMRTPDTKLKLLIEHLRAAYLEKQERFKQT